MASWFFLLLFFAPSFLCGLEISSAELDLRIEPVQDVQYKAAGSSLHLKCFYGFNRTRTNISLEWSWNSKTLYTVHTIIALVNITRLRYNDAGNYVCLAKNNQGVKIAERSVEVIVGDTPPEPPPPVLNHLFGIPPVAGVITYELPSASPLAYPITIKLLLSHPSWSALSKNLCTVSSNQQFQIADQRTQAFRTTKNLTFQADVSSTVKRLFPIKHNCADIDCDVLCATVMITNKFGCKYLKLPEIWSIDKKAECGKVDELKVNEVKTTSIVVGWKTPKCMANSSIPSLIHRIWCSPDCGSEMETLTRTGRYTNYTIRSLFPYTKLTIHVSCKIYDIESSPSTVTVWTKQDVPSKAPTVVVIRWLDEQSSKEKGVALIAWREIEDAMILRGKLELYKVIIHNLDKPHAEPLTEEVAAGNASLVTKSLEMANYSFTIQACTGGGCGRKSYPVSLKALVVKDPQHKPEVPKSDRKMNYAVVIIVPLIGIFAFVLAVWFCRRYYPRRRHYDLDDLPEIEKPSTYENDSRTMDSRNNYSIMNEAYCASTSDLPNHSNDNTQSTPNLTTMDSRNNYSSMNEAYCASTSDLPNHSKDNTQSTPNLTRCSSSSTDSTVV